MPLQSLAPGRPILGRPGAVVCALLVLALLAACGGDQRRTAAARHRLPLGADTLDLGSDVTVHEVRLGGGAATAVQPESVLARPGDVLRFVAADARGHAIAFPDTLQQPAGRDFLQRTRQLRGPPLISTGASWVVSLKDAPPGRYPFRSLTNAAAGVLVVQAPPSR